MAEENETDDVETEETEETEEQKPDPKEAEARRLGWKPQEEWDDSGGGNWLPADKFLDRNEHLKARGDKILQAQVQRQTRQIDELRQTINDLGGLLKKSESRMYKKALNDLEKRRDAAVDEGDADAYRRIEAERKDLEAQVEQEEEEAKKTQPQTKQTDEAFIEWLPDNAWYDPTDDDFDPEIAAFADGIAPQVAKKQLIGKQFYDEVTRQVKKKFPDRFGNPQRQKAPAVEGGGNKGGGNGSSLWGKVDKEGRDAFKRFVKEGVFEDKKEDREQYAQDYLEG